MIWWQSNEEMVKRIGGMSFVEQHFSNTNLSYVAEVMVIPLPPWSKVLQIEFFDGMIDPVEHVKNFRAHMTLHEYPGEISSQLFPFMLKGVVQGWLGGLLLSSVELREFMDNANDFVNIEDTIWALMRS